MPENPQAAAERKAFVDAVRHGETLEGSEIPLGTSPPNPELRPRVTWATPEPSK
jgi:hypothetical protein